MGRIAAIRRQTSETDVALELNLDGTGLARVSTGIGFFDHMLTLFAAHSLCDLSIEARGDLHVDGHHTTEDVGICLGQAIHQCLGSRAGIFRYGWSTLPMDETLATTAIDLGGRGVFVWKARFSSEKIGAFDSELVEEFWKSVAAHARMNLHVVLEHGRNNHHIAEAIFKSAARSFRQAASIDPRLGDAIPSSKGQLVDSA